MALENCKECGGQVSTEAKACPGCGAKPPKGTSRFTIFFGGMFAIIVGMMVFKDEGKPDISRAVAEPAKNSASDLRFDFAYDATKAVRDAMRNPESLKWESVRVSDDATIACLQYRAQNGFGGMNIEAVVVVNNAISKKAADLKKHCSQLMNDEIAAAR